jgi:hypothetical protein
MWTDLNEYDISMDLSLNIEFGFSDK